VNEGYWRSSVNSTESHQCYFSDACLGGYYSRCEEGYTGNLCHACKYSQATGEKYKRKGLHKCTPCPNHFQNSIIIVLMVCLAAFFLVVVIRSAILASDANYEPCLYRILIDYIHTLMIVKYYDLNWP